MGFVTNSQLKQVEQAFVDNLKNEKLIPAKAVSAKTLDPVSDDSGVTQDEPFVIQGTGTANGTTSVDTGSTAKQLEKRGNSVAVNQLVQNGDFSSGTTNWGAGANATISASNKTLTITITTNGYYALAKQTVSSYVGHKYLISFDAKYNSSTNSSIRYGTISSSLYATTKTTTISNSVFTKVCSILTISATNYNVDNALFVGGNANDETLVVNDTIDIKNVMYINLTQWFNGDIPQDILDDPKRFFNYYGGSLAYNAGTLTNATGRYLVNKHRNAWDEVWEVGSINDTTGANTNATNQIRSKNYIPVVSNATYYIHIPNGNGRVYYYDENKNYLETINVSNNTFVIYPNCRYIRFRSGSGYGSTYSNNITISLYYSPDEGGADYDQYYPYEAPSVYDTGDEVLRSAGDIRDVKLPTGEITRYVGDIDLGEKNYDYAYFGANTFSFSLTDSALSATAVKGICAKYNYLPYSDRLNANCWTFNNNSLIIHDSNYSSAATFKTAMNGVHLFYELAIPTTESGTAFSPTIEIDDYGTNEWLKTYDATTPANNEYTAVPQACEIFYPADISLFIDTLGQRSDIGWDAAEIVSQEELDEVVNGVRSVAKAELAENLETDLGSEQTYEHLYLSPLNIGVNDGDYAKNTNIKGKSYAVNQLVPDNKKTGSNTNSDTRTYVYFRVGQNISPYTTILSTSISSAAVYVYTFESTFTGNARVFHDGAITNIIFLDSFPVINAHKYILIINFTGVNIGTVGGLTWKSFNIIDLTQFFGSNANIPADLLTHPETFSNYYQGDLSYNTGILKDSKPVALVSTNANIWDEVWESGQIDNTTGQNTANANYGRSKNYIEINPNLTYYFKNPSTTQVLYVYGYDKDKNYINYTATSTVGGTLTPPWKNAKYIRICQYQWTSYNNDVCINISDSSFNGTYVPHVSRRYPLTLPVMRSAGSVQDDISKVKVGTVDLGTLDWSGGDTYNFYSTILLPNTGVAYESTCSAYSYQLGAYAKTSMNNKTAGLNYDGRIYLRDDTYTTPAALKTALSGVMLNYQLATPTDQEAITLPENVEVFTNGTLMIEYDDGYEVPCDAEFLYQVNIKRFIEGLGSREDINWNKDSIVSQEELTQSLDDATEDFKDKLENGEIIPEQSKLTSNIKPYGDDSGALQENPFISQGTGTNNNVEIVTTGNVCEIKSKNGNTVVVNQLLDKSGFGSSDADFVDGIKFTNNNDGTVTIVVDSGGATATRNFKLVQSSGYMTLPAHYLYGGYSPNENIYVANSYNNSAYSNEIKQNDRTGSQQFRPVIQVHEGCVAGTYKITPIISDITQWFNGNIPQDLLDNPSHFSWYYNGSLAYNTGSLVNANGRYLECGQGRNLFDKATVVSGQLAVDGTVSSSSSYKTSDYILITPNCSYYISRSDSSRIKFYDANKQPLRTDDYDVSITGTADSTFTSTPNAIYVRFTIANSRVDTAGLSLYYTPEQGGEGYNEHYDYVAPKVIDTGSEELLAFDKKTPDGTWYHNTLEVDLGTLNWSKASNNRFQSDGIASLIKLPSDNNIVANIVCSIFERVSSSDVYSNTKNNIIAIDTAGKINIYVSDTYYINTSEAQFKTAMSGVKLQAEANTPTTEQGTPFSAYPDINDYSYMLWRDTDNALVEIPQGASIFYPVNYAGFLDDVYARTDGDASDIALESEITDAALSARGYNKTEDLSNLFGYKEALGGTLRQMLAIKESLDFNDTKFIDLGTKTFSYYDNRFFYIQISDIEKTAVSNKSLLLTTLYKTDSPSYSGSSAAADMTIRQCLDDSGNSNNILIKNNNYTYDAAGAAALKLAMKGVLLAYKKSSS